jgi:hemoglobin
MESAMSDIVTHAEREIDEAMIRNLVHAFYAEIRRDALLGPIFESRITNWDAHLGQMCAFWSAVMLKTGRYHGTPMQKHMILPIDGRYFERWLELFQATARRECGEAAARFFAAAERIAASLEAGIGVHQGKLPEGRASHG